MKGSLYSPGSVKLSSQLIIADIDGTITRTDEVSSAVKASLERMVHYGWDILYATSRIYDTALSLIRDLPGLPFGIFAGGADIRWINEGDHIFLSTIPENEAAAILRILWNEPLEMQIFSSERIYTRSVDNNSRMFFKGIGVPVRLVNSWQEIDFSPVKILLYSPQENILKIRDILRQLESRVNIISAGEPFIDILPCGVSKAFAFDKTMLMFNSEPEQILFLGDSENDLELAEKSDMLAVPEDADPRIVSIADIIYPSDLDSGIKLLADLIKDGLPSIKGPVLL